MSFYAGMAEDEQYIFTMQLIKTIAKNMSTHYRVYPNGTPLSETLGIMEEDGSMVYNDPVVNNFLWHIECLTDKVIDFRQRMSVMARMNLGRHWSDHSSVGIGGTNIIGAIKERGVEGLSAFVLAVCCMSLNEIITKTKNSLNYFPSKKMDSLYTVMVKTNSLVPDGNSFIDAHIMDALVSYSAEALSKNLSSSIKFLLEIHKPDDCTERMLKGLSSIILTEVSIRSNEEVLCIIPLIHDGQEPGKEIGSYSLEYRQALNAKGAAAYHLDFDNMTRVGGEAQVLLELAKHFPRRAARRLRGGALEDSIGL
jgi:hypothetical protein